MFLIVWISGCETSLNENSLLGPNDNNYDSCIEGQVTNSQTGIGIPDATISFMSGCSTVTDTDGCYEICVGPNIYDITISADNFARRCYKWIQIIGGRSYTKNFALTPVEYMGTLHGRVTDSETGNGIYRAVISSDDMQSSSSDVNGYYRFDVGAGSRTVVIGASGYDTGIKRIEINAQTMHSLNVVLTKSSGGG